MGRQLLLPLKKRVGDISRRLKVSTKRRLSYHVLILQIAIAHFACSGLVPHFVGTITLSISNLIVLAIFVFGWWELDRLERESGIDPLTGLYNRPGGFQVFQHHILSRTYDTAKMTAVLFVDLDSFKEVNDGHGGHATGDIALKRVAEILRHVFRKGDILIRWSGDEFVVILFSTNMDTAYGRAEALRTSIESDDSLSFYEGRVHVTASIGLVLLDTPPMEQGDLEKSIKSADRQMYEAKRQGKNCIKMIR